MSDLGERFLQRPADGFFIIDNEKVTHGGDLGSFGCPVHFERAKLGGGKLRRPFIGNRMRLSPLSSGTLEERANRAQ
jgi:hypothetical protein